MGRFKTLTPRKLKRATETAIKTRPPMAAAMSSWAALTFLGSPEAVTIMKAP